MLTKNNCYGKGAKGLLRCVDEALSLFSALKKKAAYNFYTYLQNHRHRIVNYEHFYTKDICSIASGAVESTVKQIDRRLKILGAQWKIENVPYAERLSEGVSFRNSLGQILKHRCVTRS